MMKKIPFSPKSLILIFALSSGMAFAQTKHQTPAAFGKRISASSINPKNGFIRCATDEYEEFLQGQNPKRKNRAKFESWLQPLIENYKSMQSVSSQSNGIITIPVVVHVIHSGQPVGTAPNITDAQVQSQITVLNNDFRRLAGTPGFNTNPIGADIQIQFALAKVDPNGNPTNGIDHVNLCRSSWSMIDIDATVKPQTVWNPDEYLNMWSVDISDRGILGYAQYPSASGLPGLDSDEGGAATDGVVSNYNCFGSIDYDNGTFVLEAPYDKGRTMTHEVGHWLGLRHIWGDGDCSVDDFCADTPNAAGPNYDCPTGRDSCPDPGLDMIQNYMDYTDDPCMNIFTADQKNRITTVLNNAIRRVTLRNSTKDLPIQLFANDAEIKIERTCSAGTVCGSTAIQTITLANRGTSNLTSVLLSYTVNGGAAATYTWTGNLSPNGFATFDMPVSATASGPIVITVANANGTADQRASNNSATGTFTSPIPQNFNYTQVSFTLQKDHYGSETTWDLKNGEGTTLYSGGPYSDTPEDGPLPAVFTQEWNLPANGCYTFQINDIAGDGICCDYGNGSYSVKSLDGTVTLISGGSFEAIERKSFTNNVSTGEFTTSPAIYVYPNPSKTSLNIAIPAEFGLPDDYTINNYLGQKIEEKKIATENDLLINTSALSNGVYLITISKGNQKRTLRFIKK
ncbi:MAG TPA: M43 family zinc metalloprotease [Flavobacterium sp.]|jgi:hypothetical protein